MRVLIHVGDKKIAVGSARPLKLRSKDPGIDDLVRRLLEAINAAGQTQDRYRSWVKVNDEDPGHQFHGNQWTGGLGSKPDTVKAKGVKAGTHELLSSGHPFTMEELQKVTGATTLKQISDAIAMLKNPKYAGSQGTLEIVKENGQFLVKAKATAAASVLPPHLMALSEKMEAKAAEPSFTSTEIDPFPNAEPLDPEPELEASMLLPEVNMKAGQPTQPIPGIGSKAAADEFYESQVKAITEVAAQYAQQMPVAQHAEIAQAFKDGKAIAMAQWASNVKGIPMTPKPQEVFAADKQLIADLAAGKDKETALSAWKKNTSLEKQGNFPPKAAINPMPKVAPPAPAVAPAKEHAQTLTAPAHYVPDEHVHVEASDFAASPGAVNGKFTKEMSKLKLQLADGLSDSAQNALDVQNKISVQKALELRLMASPAFQAIQESTTKNGHKSLAAMLISSWAGSSGDHKPISVASQLAIRDAFNMAPESVSTDAFHLLQSTKGDEHEVYRQTAVQIGFKVDTPEAMNTFKAGMRDFALAQYNNTQDHLKKLGITEVYVARGMKIHHSGGPELVNLKLQPASSFSAEFDTAKSFAGGHSMYFSKVPASQVLGTYKTGYGCTREQEVVVLAHPNTRSVRVPSGQAGASMSNAAAVIASVLKAPAAVGMKPILPLGKPPGLKLSPILKEAHAAAQKGDVEGVKAAVAKASMMPGYKLTTAHITQSVLPKAEDHKVALEAYHAANPKQVKAVKAATPAAQTNLTPAHTAGAHPPAHHVAHSHYDPQEYAGWQAKGHTEFQLGKKLAMKKFVAKKKGI